MSTVADPEEDDAAGVGEEDFEVGMKQNAMERDAADADQDGKLDLAEFCQLVRDREEGEFTQEELKKRFDALDADGSGKVDLAEYLVWSLRDSLQRSSDRVVDLFKKWDEDGSGKIDKREFTRAVRSMGFSDITDELAGTVFDTLDDDKSGELEYKELNIMLRKGAGSDAVQRRLKRGNLADHGRGAKLTAKNLNKNFQGSRVAALPEMVKLDVSSGTSLHDQLAMALSENSAKLVDLFREWDEDGNGAVDRKEFRMAVAALGYDAPKKDLDAFFDTFDVSGDGEIEYNELKKGLAKAMKVADVKVRDLKEAKQAAAKAAAAARATERNAAVDAAVAKANLHLPLFPELPPEESGGELTIQASGPHKHTIIMLHSMSGAAEIFSRLFRRFGILAAGFKFVFPRAPPRNVSIQGNEATLNGWFLPARRDDGSVALNSAADSKQLEWQTKRIHGILEREAAYLGGDPSRLVLGGLHQGGAVALHAAMTFHSLIAAVVCLRSEPLAVTLPLISAKAEPKATKVFVFAGDRDVVHPIESMRLAYEPLVSASFSVEWHVEYELTHSAICLNEQRFAAYWIVRTCLGEMHGDVLKQSIMTVKKQTPPVMAKKPRPRPQSARPAAPADTGFVHSLYREPEWRRVPLKGPAWNTSTAPGFASPFSPIFAKASALCTRIDRGGPLLGRIIKHSLEMPTQPDLLGGARGDGEFVVPGMVLSSRPPTRVQSARPARREWNGDTRPSHVPNAELAVGMGLVPSRPMSPRNHKRPMSAMLPPRITSQAEQRPIMPQGAPAGSTSPTRGEGPRTQKLKGQSATS